MLWHLLALYPLVSISNWATDHIRLGKMTNKECLEKEGAFFLFFKMIIHFWAVWAIWHWLHHFNLV